MRFSVPIPIIPLKCIYVLKVLRGRYFFGTKILLSQIVAIKQCPLCGSVENKNKFYHPGAPDRDSSEEDVDEPDSDDSSEMDETECERRRNYCIDNLGTC